jgi:hypothetical protein
MVLLLAVGFFAASLVNKVWLFPATILFVIIAGCYLRAPVNYEVLPEGLIVHFRLGQKSFGPIVKVTPVGESTGWSLRLWGNGGLFAGTGIFWNRTWGVFRAYVTTSDRSHLILLETKNGKVLISPEHPAEVVKGCADWS